MPGDITVEQGPVTPSIDFQIHITRKQAILDVLRQISLASKHPGADADRLLVLSQVLQALVQA